MAREICLERVFLGSEQQTSPALLPRQAKEVFDHRVKSLLLSRHKRHITIDCDSVVSYPNLRTHLGRTESCPAKRGLAGQFSRIGGAFMAKDKKTKTAIYHPPKKGMPYLVVTVSPEGVTATAVESKDEARILTSKKTLKVLVEDNHENSDAVR